MAEMIDCTTIIETATEKITKYHEVTILINSDNNQIMEQLNQF